MTARTTYAVRDGRGLVARVADPDRAERLSRAGLVVTAVTRGAGR